MQLTEDIFGKPFYISPFTTLNTQRPCGNFPLSTWLWVNDSVVPYGKIWDDQNAVIQRLTKTIKGRPF
jgi:hypothetical protein